MCDDKAQTNKRLHCLQKREIWRTERKYQHQWLRQMGLCLTGAVVQKLLRPFVLPKLAPSLGENATVRMREERRLRTEQKQLSPPWLQEPPSSKTLGLLQFEDNIG